MCAINNSLFNGSETKEVDIPHEIHVICAEKLATGSYHQVTVTPGKVILYLIPNPLPKLGCDKSWWVTKECHGMCWEAWEEALEKKSITAVS